MKKRILAGLALGVTAALTLGACASESVPEPAPGGDAGDKMELTIGVFNGWPEGEAASFLWKLILEEKGYDVTLEYADAGPVFLGLSQGDYDIAFDGWLPTTHATYMEQYGDSLEDLGSWNDDAVLTLAVNDDAPITSIEELAANADAFGNRIVGIEPGAGLTEAMQKSVIPGYGLEGMEFLTSSTGAMLAELSAALDAGENVVVTLWRPHWAYDEFPIRDLLDPQETLGASESIHSIARLGFADDYPQLAAWVKGFRMSSDLLYSLENLMYNSGTDITDFEPVVAGWMAENQDYVDGLTG